LASAGTSIGISVISKTGDAGGAGFNFDLDFFGSGVTSGTGGDIVAAVVARVIVTGVVVTAAGSVVAAVVTGVVVTAAGSVVVTAVVTGVFLRPRFFLSVSKTGRDNEREAEAFFIGTIKKW
jgi:hypothetical protein